MRYLIDMHTHTIVSGHAYSTIKEMAKNASEKGMTHLGISEHAPLMPGSCHELYFHNLKILPKTIYGVNMLYGAEVNIKNYEGGVDLRRGILKRLDYVIASLHIPCIDPGTIKENTQAIVGALQNPFVNILGHPDDDRYPIDYEVVVKTAKANHKLLELNNSSLSPNASRVGAYENDKILLSLCKQYEVPILIGSDAHYEDYVGEFDLSYKLLEKMDFPEYLIANSNFSIIKEYLEKTE